MVLPVMHAFIASFPFWVVWAVICNHPLHAATLSVHWDKVRGEHEPGGRRWHHTRNRGDHPWTRRHRRAPGKREEFGQIANSSVSTPRVLRTPGIPEESQVDFRAASVALGTGIAALFVLAGVAGCFSGKRAGDVHAFGGSVAGRGALSDGKFVLEFDRHGGLPYRRFNWSLDSGPRGHGPILSAAGDEVASFSGSLLAVPNGEMRLQSDGACWAILGRPTPNLRRPGQLWDFKVCKADGSPFAVVRQRSEYKCIVEDAATQRRVMEVVGNFFHPEFMSGERIVQAWLSKEAVGAQCQVRPEAGRPRFHVTTSAGADADFVLAVLVGLQDVHAASQHCVGLAGQRQEQSKPDSGLKPKSIA